MWNNEKKYACIGMSLNIPELKEFTFLETTNDMSKHVVVYSKGISLA